MKKLFILMTLSLLLVSCGETPNTETNTKNTAKVETKTEKKAEKMVVTTSILPLASITNAIGGENVDVKNMVGAGQSPHSFDLKSSHLVNLEKSEAVITVGMDHIDGFLDKKLADKEVLPLAEGMELLEMEAHDHDEHEDEHHDEEHENTHEGEKHEEDKHDDEHKDEDNHADEDEHHDEEHEDNHEGEEHEEDEHEDEHGEHEQDPHIWNSPKNAKLLAEKITTFLSAIQPNNKEEFEANKTAFVKEIENLLADFKKNTEGKEQQHFILFHNAHNYLLRDANIDTDKKLVFRKSVLNEPNSNDMKELIDEIKEHNIQIAFVEPQFKSANFEKLAKEYNISIYTLDPLGADESAKGYIENTKNNLESLEKIFK